MLVTLFYVNDIGVGSCLTLGRGHVLGVATAVTVEREIFSDS